jgi:hypothetical protein
MKKFIQKILTVLALLVSSIIVNAQTIIIDPTTAGAFEGASFAADGWSVLNNTTTNQWVQSTGATAGFTGTQCAYITNNAAGSPPPHAYTNSASRVSALYRDVTIPSGETTISLTFDWINLGETGYDRLQVWAVPTSYTPLNGTASMTTTGSAPTGRVQLGTGVTGYVGSSATVWQSASITVPAAYAGTSFRLVFQWRNDGSGGSNPPIGIDKVSLVSSCSGAVTAPATAIGTTIATLNAATFASATGYNFRYRIVGSPTWTMASGNPYVGTVASITGLTAASNYEFQVSATGPVCNAWSVSSTFTTACNTAAITQSEGFNAVTIPVCWSTTIVAVQTGTKISYVTTGLYPTTSPQEGTGFVQFNSFSSTNGSTGSEERLVSLPVSTTGTASVDVEFQWRNENNTSYTTATEGVQVQYSLNGTTWVDAGSFFPRHDGSLGSGTAVWNKKTVTLPGVAGNQALLYVGFKFHSDYGDNCFLDAAIIKPTPSCGAPSATAATAITASSADYNFTCSSCSGNYIVEYGATGFTPGTGATAGTGGTVIATSTLTGTIGSLAALTGYQYYVRQICTGPTYSTNAGPVSFTTSMDCSTATNISGCATNFTVTTTAATGAYNPVATSCGYGTPGEEKLYTFTPTITGVHQLSNVSGATGGYLDVFIKASSGGCGSTGWTCINDYSTTVESNATPLLTAGTQYYLLFDGEVAAAHNQTFNIVCPIPAPANDECATAVVH